MMLDFPDILIVPLLCEWLSSDDLCRLDCSFCFVSGRRNSFLKLISSEVFVHNGTHLMQNIELQLHHLPPDSDERIVKNEKREILYLRWIIMKQIRVKEIALHLLISTILDLMLTNDISIICSKVERLSIHTDFWPVETITFYMLKSLLERMPRLRYLSILNVKVIYGQIDYLITNVSLQSQLTNLTELRLENCELDDETFRLLFSKSSRLQILQCSLRNKCSLNISLEYFKLRELEVNIGLPFIENNEIEVITKTSKMLSKLHLFWDVSIYGRGSICDVLLHAIAEQCANITDLSFGYFSDTISDAGMSAILTKYSLQLTKLAIPSCSSLNEITFDIIATQCKILRYLDVSGCHKMNLKMLLNIISGCTQLTELHAKETFRVYGKLYDYIQIEGELTEVPIKSNENFEAYNILPINDSMRVLNLSEHKYCMSVKILHAVLRLLPNLTEINLQLCNYELITNDVFQTELQLCPFLLRLNLQNVDEMTNDILDSIVLFAPQLQHVNVRGSYFPSEIIAKFNKQMPHCAVEYDDETFFEEYEKD